MKSSNYYSQCGEDKFLWEKYFSSYSAPTSQCYYYEMGAMDGVTYSNTKFFEDSCGWTGVLVEGNPLIFPRLLLNRPNNVLMNALCSDSKEPLNFNICCNVPAVCSVEMSKPIDFDQKYYNHSQMIKCRLIPVTLDSIFERANVPRIDLCIIDVEGHEINVLKSCSFKLPVVMCLIEFLDDDVKNEEVKTIMASHGFSYIERCAHNAVFINDKFKHYFTSLSV